MMIVVTWRAGCSGGCDDAGNDDDADDDGDSNGDDDDGDGDDGDDGDDDDDGGCDDDHFVTWTAECGGGCDLRENTVGAKSRDERRWGEARC